MGYAAGGSSCRSALEFARLLDLYHELGIPLQVSFQYPAAPQPGVWQRWRGAPTADNQAAWLEAFVLVALGNPSCAAVHWGAVRDHPGQRWPASGLVAADGAPRRALRRLRALRRACRP